MDVRIAKKLKDGIVKVKSRDYMNVSQNVRMESEMKKRKRMTNTAMSKMVVMAATPKHAPKSTAGNAKSSLQTKMTIERKSMSARSTAQTERDCSQRRTTQNTAISRKITEIVNQVATLLSARSTTDGYASQNRKALKSSHALQIVKTLAELEMS